MFVFSHLQAELYTEYKELMYGPDAGNVIVKNSNSDTEVIGPGCKLHTPGGYHDSSSEVEALNIKIANRRQQFGVFEKSPAAKTAFLQSDSDSALEIQPNKKQKCSAARKPVKVPSAPRSTRSKKKLPRVRSASPSPHTPEQVKKPNNTGRKTQLQKLASPKANKHGKSQIPTSSPFTEFSTPVKAGVKQKKKVRLAVSISEQIDNVCVRKGKRKPGRPRKNRKGGKRVRKQVHKKKRTVRGKVQ